MKKPILKKTHITLRIISLMLIGHITGSSIITADKNTPLLRAQATVLQVIVSWRAALNG